MSLNFDFIDMRKTGSEMAGKGLVQQRLLQLLQRGELALVNGFDPPALGTTADKGAGEKRAAAKRLRGSVALQKA
jgi:hypothetical protein